MPRFLVAAAAAFLATAAVPAQFAVSAASPANNARGVPASASVTLTFNAPVDPATVTPQTFRVMGRWSGPVPGQFTIAGGGTTVTFTPARPMFATEIASLWVSRGLRSAAGAPLAGGFYATWWVDSALSSGTHVLADVVDYRRPGEGLVRTYGFFAGDVDGDGSTDMSATNEVSFDVRLLKNDGCGRFGPIAVTAMPSGEEPSPNEGGDFDGDGWIDLATGNQNGQSVAVFFNNGAGGYLAPVVIPVGGAVHGIAVLDFDADGRLDLAATNRNDVALVRNLGSRTFQAPTFVNGGGNGEWAIQAGDADGDGKADLFVGHAFSANVSVLRGDGNGGFVAGPLQGCGGFPWQMALGDVDGDGRTDCIVAEASAGRASVLRGNGVGGLLPFVGYGVGSNPVSVDVGDIDGDDDLDVVVASFGAANATVLRNNGSGTFGGATTLASTAAGSCAVIVDYDRDGDTDVILVDELDDKAFVYRQVGPSPAGVQAPTCDAAFRVDSQAARAGFGGRPAPVLPAGSRSFLEVSGAPSQLFLVFVGSPQPVGAATPFGIANLDLGQPVLTALGGLLDGFGEARLVLDVPPGLPAGSSLTMQCLLSTPASFAASNPESVRF